MRPAGAIASALVASGALLACNAIFGIGEGELAQLDGSVVVVRPDGGSTFVDSDATDAAPFDAADAEVPFVPAHVGPESYSPDATSAIRGSLELVVGAGTVTATTPDGTPVMVPSSAVRWSDSCKCTVLSAANWTLASGEKLTIRQEVPLVIVARTVAWNGTVIVTRTRSNPIGRTVLDASASDAEDASDAEAVVEPCDGKPGMAATFGVGGGGGGGGLTPGGNGGGNAASAGGAGGTFAPDTRALTFGGRGGAGAAGCPPGEGGGALQVSALHSLIVQGAVVVNGEGAPECPSLMGGGGGAGAGGGLWLEAPHGDLSGMFAAVGGGGAGGSGSETTSAGPAGQTSLGTAVAVGGGYSGGNGGGYLSPIHGTPPTLLFGGRSGGGGGGAAGLIRTRGGVEKSGEFVPRPIIVP